MYKFIEWNTLGKGLSLKESPEKVLNTPLHEMCHVAVWMIDYVDEHHGPYWKRWTRHAESVHPDISKIQVNDNCSIYTNCLYGCTHCGYDMGKNSPSLANDPAW